MMEWAGLAEAKRKRAGESGVTVGGEQMMGQYDEGRRTKV